MAQNEGKKFEEDWKNSFKKVNAYFFRIKDSAASFSGGNSSFTRSNPYDCFVLYEGYFFPMELKSTKGASFSFEKEGSGNGNKLCIRIYPWATDKWSIAPGSMGVTSVQEYIAGTFVYTRR